MSIVDYPLPSAGITPGAPVRREATGRRLHRLAEVRQQQGVSRRTVARRMNVEVSQVKQQEEETADIPVSVLYEWQQALEVPVAELLVEVDEPLSGPVMKRAKMVRIMKTAAAILERAQQPGIRRMAQMLVEQLVELMPELAEVTPWHAVGKRRTKDDIGQAAHRRLSLDVFRVVGD
ncbi:MAG: helix-turn-helix transcriptional regulator [Pirellulales bacterium]|nr:helix-turn-helix transcriptional regulator [Pirellulales bacterium]